MKSFDRNRNRIGIWERKPVLICIGIVLVAFSWSVVRFWLTLGETERNKELAKERVDALREQRATLIADIEKLETDRGKEEIFRENYGLAKAGEEVIVIVDDEAPPQPKKGMFSGLTSFFKNLFR